MYYQINAMCKKRAQKENEEKWGNASQCIGFERIHLSLEPPPIASIRNLPEDGGGRPTALEAY